MEEPMERDAFSSPMSSRPYRSHKIPACNVCRKRKTRCDVNIPARPCRFCRERDLECEQSSNKHQTSSSPQNASLAKHRRTTLSNPPASPTGEQAAGQQNALAQFPSLIESSSLLMSTTMAEDIEVLEHYLICNTDADVSSNKSYIRIPKAEGESIMYLTLPRRKWLHTSKDPGKTQRQVMDQILGPLKDDVIKLYFDNIHPCFPILHEPKFWELWRNDPGRISSTLICDMYATALLYWNNSDRLRRRSRPDLAFAWKQAVSASRDDFMAPSITTIHATLLGLTGRPVLQVSDNIANTGRVVTLSHSLGLHRDPTAWRATTAEKQLRIRLFWGVLIHDYWSSLAHGTPANIQPQNYDVPLPAKEPLQSPTFVYLCSLSQILGDVLPFVYTLRPNYDDIWKSIRRIECKLDEWEDSLPGFFKTTGQHGNGSIVNGSSSLWFCFLSLRLLLCRLAFRATLNSSPRPQLEVKQYRLASLRDSASLLADYITSLEDSQLREFWLPYTAHLLVSATTMLLRCTVETSNLEAKRECASKLVKLANRLQTARDHSQWDLADFCLERCRQPIDKVASVVLGTDAAAREVDTSAIPAATITPNNMTGDNDMFAGNDPVASLPEQGDFFFPVDSLDYPWETLWHNFDSPWTISI